MFLIILITLCILLLFFVLRQQKNDTKPNSENAPERKQSDSLAVLDDNGNPITTRSKLRITTRLVGNPETQGLRYFCIKDKGYHVSVWPKDSNSWLPGLDYVEFNIAGLSYRDNIDHYRGEHVGTLEAEPTNQYDPHAIKVLANDGHHVGYVPKNMTADVRQLTSLPCPCYFYIGRSDDGTYYSDCYIKPASQ